MTRDIANSLYPYFERLYELNHNLIALCGIDVLDHKQQFTKYLENVILTLPRLIPCKYNKTDDRYELKDTDGLLVFSDELSFIQKDYEDVINEFYDILVVIIKIRNKLEHRMHCASQVYSGSGSIVLFEATYEIDKESFDIQGRSLIALAQKLNQLFSKIQAEVEQFMFEHSKNNYDYYGRLVRYDFCNFNKIYQSDLLRICGGAMLPF